MTRKQITIVAIDDNPGDLEILKYSLLQIPALDINYIPFKDSNTALKELTKHPVDIIFVDYLLADTNGVEVVKAIRNSGIEHPVIALTGHGDEYIAAEITRAGANDYLIKDELSSDILRHVINNALEQYRLRKEKVRLNEELRQTQKMNSIGTLAGGIAHDFNNMLTAMIGLIEILILENEGKNSKKHLLQLKDCCIEMTELVHQLLTFSRNKKPGIINVNIAEIIKGVTTIFKHTLPKEIKINTLYTDKQLIMRGNPTELYQVILNLGINASEAMSKGGTLTIRAKHIKLDSDFLSNDKLLSSNDYILLEVEDNGAGIRHEAMDRIFEPFYTTKSFSNKRGTGLGLSIVWRIVEEHFGFIRVQSEIGKGTIFKIYFPAVKDKLKGMEISQESEVLSGKGTILIVDDEKTVLEVMEKMVNVLGYKVHCASSGKEALDLYQKLKNKIDLVILDISMLDMNGNECFEKLKEINNQVKVVFTSGHNIEVESEKLLINSSRGIVQKPFRLNTISKIIGSIIEE